MSDGTIIKIDEKCKYAIVFDIPLTFAEIEKIRNILDEFMKSQETFIILDKGATIVRLADEE